MINKRELREIELKKNDNQIAIFASFIISIFSIFCYGFNASSLLFSFLTFILNVVLFLFIEPFIEEKLQLKKIHRYSGRKRDSILKLITLPPILLIWYFVTSNYKYLQN